jgi:acetolactate synthase-1/2/3 large subunit
MNATGHERPGKSDWRHRVEAAIRYRPPEWQRLEAPAGSPLHAAVVSRAVQEFLDADAQAVFISDGGEFGQWAQACIAAPHRLINGPSGAIGSSVPFALAARLAFPDSRIVTMLGDGTFGFHAMEFDTALRYQLPFIAVVGHDAAWNAELQMQLRSFGAERAVGCELLPTPYEGLAESLGGYGSCVTSASELRARLADARESGLPACLNVPIERNAAPVIRRSV